jgi:hypothetical protein
MNLPSIAVESYNNSSIPETKNHHESEHIFLDFGLKKLVENC